MASQIVWFDVPVTDLDRACRFYAAVLAGHIHRESIPGGGGIGVLPHGGCDVGGCLVPADKPPTGSGPLLYLNCQGRLDAAISAAELHGGKVLEPKHSIAPHGFRAVLLDSEGNRIALHSS